MPEFHHANLLQFDSGQIEPRGRRGRRAHAPTSTGSLPKPTPPTFYRAEGDLATSKVVACPEGIIAQL